MAEYKEIEYVLYSILCHIVWTLFICYKYFMALRIEKREEILRCLKDEKDYKNSRL